MTRLAATVGRSAAAALQREFLRALLVRFANSGDRRVVAYTPADRQRQFLCLARSAGVADAWRFEVQADGNLGARMRDFFTRAFRRGDGHVVLLGSDSPNVPCRLVEQAFGLLRETEVVLGPTPDGGYYLVAARTRPPPIFDDIRWSSSSVLPATIEKLRQARCPYRQLDEWYDVDHIDDLVRLEQDLSQQASTDDPLGRLGRAVRAVLRDGNRQSR